MSFTPAEGHLGNTPPLTEHTGEGRGTSTTHHPSLSAQERGRGTDEWLDAKQDGDSKAGPKQRPGSPAPSCVFMKTDNPIIQPLVFKNYASNIESPIQQKRPPSPVPSCVSMKSDQSIDQPPRLGQGHSPADQSSIQQKRPSSPVPSCVSMKSDRSMDIPPRLGQGQSPIQQKRPPSPVPSCVSMKSDQSIDQPPRLGQGHSPADQSPIQQKRPPSPVPSCVSMKSDQSIDQPPRLGQGHSPADQSSIQQKRPPCPVPSCVSMKSDRSMDIPPRLGQGHSPADQSYDHLYFSSQASLDSHTLDHEWSMTLPDTSQYESNEDGPARNREEHSQEKLKSYLRTKVQHIHESPSNHVLLTKTYTEVYITEGDCGEVNVEHELREIEAASRGDGADGAPIKCNDIFKPQPGQSQPIRTVVTKGIAGIGKTVCVQKFVLDWVEGVANQDVKYLFLLSFRELNLLKAEHLSLPELLSHFVGEFRNMQVLNNDGHQVLFIFDGLDECRFPLTFEKNKKFCQPAIATSLDALLTNLIQGNLLPSALIWITSRPAAAARIPQGFVDRVTAVRGFGDPQKKEYFRKRIKDEILAKKVITHIQSLRSLHIMCHIPVFCWITATVLERLLAESEGSTVPKNLTQMYTHFLMIQISVAKKYTDAGNPIIFKLGKLAFQQLEMGHLIFYEEDLRECGIDVTEASVYSGVCTQIFREEAGLDQGKVFSFVHLSIQEFLAALYVLLRFHSKGSAPHQSSSLAALFTAPTLADLQKTAVDKALQQPNGNLDLFLRFLLGLCAGSLLPDQNLLQSFFPHVRSTSTSNAEVIGYIKTRVMISPSPEQSINLFHCLNELNDQALQEQIRQYQSSRSLCKVTLSPELWSALVFVLLMSENSLEVFDLGKYSAHPSDKCLFRMRPVLRESRRAELVACNLTERSCETLASVIGSQASHVRELVLSENDIQDAGVARLCRAIENPTCKLEKLRLSKCGIRAGGFECLMKALIKNPSHLRELDLSDNILQYKGMNLLSEVCQDHRCRIKKLMLINCNIKDCRPLAVGLSSKTSSLRELDLSKNRIGDSGVIDLSNGLRNTNCKLSSLRLSGCGVTEVGCRQLASALRLNPGHLRELFLSFNRHGVLGSCALTAVKLDPHSKLEKLML